MLINFFKMNNYQIFFYILNFSCVILLIDFKYFYYKGWSKAALITFLFIDIFCWKFVALNGGIFRMKWHCSIKLMVFQVWAEWQQLFFVKWNTLYIIMILKSSDISLYQWILTSWILYSKKNISLLVVFYFPFEF